MSQVDKKDLAGENSNELKRMLKESYEYMFHQTLIFMEIAFPHEKGDGSENEKRYNVIRSKVLRIGNDKIRDLDKVLASFAVFKLNEYTLKPNQYIETEILDFKSKFQLNGKGGKANG